MLTFLSNGLLLYLQGTTKTIQLKHFLHFRKLICRNVLPVVKSLEQLRSIPLARSSQNMCEWLLANAAMGNKSHYKINSGRPTACRNISVLLLPHLAPSRPFLWKKLRSLSRILPSWKPSVLQLSFPRNKEVFIMWPSILSHYIFTINMRKTPWMDKKLLLINMIIVLNNISKQQNTITSQLLQ